MEFSRVERLKAKSVSEANFYAECLNANPRSVLFFLDFRDKSLEEKNQMMNEFLAKNYSEKEINSRVRQMIKAFDKEKANNQDWFWLREDDNRAINWMWGYIKLNHQSDFSLIRHRDNISLQSLNLEYLNSNTSSSISRYNLLVKAYQETNTPKDIVEEISKYLLGKWHETLQFKGLETLLDIKDKTQCDWAMEHLKKQRLGLGYNRLFNPIDSEDKYWCAIATFDLINDNRDKELLILKMRKAWTQKKYRSKENGKKSHSISMSPITKIKLDEIVERTDGKICDTVERLINEEYKRLN